MVRYLRAAVVILALMCLGQTLHRHTTYTTFTGSQVTFAWDAQAAADSYKWELVSYERGNSVFASGSTATTNATVTIPQTGHWIVRVKAVNANGESDWSESTGAGAQVEGADETWWIHAWVAAPTGPSID